jgi:hypothetical protein
LNCRRSAGLTRANSGSGQNIVEVEHLKIVSVPVVIAELEKAGVVINQKHPKSSVGNAMRRLARADVGVLKEIKPGSGRTPATYQFVEPKRKGDGAFGAFYAILQTSHPHS